ncbi:MAG: hypothetical protein KKF89_03155 [Nanoarchaeota archaeon]|nr:hypothetical protein [Nanoarchaeota archaeon]
MGCSIKPYGYYLALHGGARAYVGVDITMYIRKLLGVNISLAWEELREDKTAIPLVSLQHEMISFLDASYRANKKYSFITSSYGNYPDDESLFSNKFFDLLSEYIPKCTALNGGVLQNHTKFDLKGYVQLKNECPFEACYSFLKKVA